MVGRGLISKAELAGLVDIRCSGVIEREKSKTTPSF